LQGTSRPQSLNGNGRGKIKPTTKMLSNPLAETHDGNYIGIKIQEEDRPNSKKLSNPLAEFKEIGRYRA